MNLLEREKNYKLNRRPLTLRDILSYSLESETGIKIDLICDDMNEQDFQKICSVLSNCSNLQVLKLEFGHNCMIIDDQCLSALATALSNCKKIFDFRLCLIDANLTEKGIQDLGLILERFKGLTKLEIDFHQEKLEDADAKYLGVCLSNCVNLTTFIFQSKYSEIGYKGISDLCQALITSANLQNIFIEKNLNHQEKVYEHQLDQLGICSALTKYPKLQLKLGINIEVIGTKNLLDLGNDLAQCSNLQTLELLFMNEIDAQCILGLGYALAKSQSISILKLDLRQIQLIYVIFFIHFLANFFQFQLEIKHYYFCLK
ncbi:transmembrane protein, putative (macronuclear) [Tetrahymena thermophila SB210]|uniref:Transmembrane protein, putative n=1 Tax=Tetrahymena thermophila (strain SB210) TaxID=312017 RepID=W7XCB6_TETTS|nr:transmembrane protein, putative [Tetrahymena thermophila SB210]EWS74188.1 transmembrane protein, putative [Tetrahymena thermophila SB210]|eukprot:XP_012653280.1 transmembrane protein, putative [Tetrahymena thermophila SB210]